MSEFIKFCAGVMLGIGIQLCLMGEALGILYFGLSILLIGLDETKGEET